MILYDYSDEERKRFHDVHSAYEEIQSGVHLVLIFAVGTNVIPCIGIEKYVYCA